MEAAFEKINDEMQKDPRNPYLEIVGTYIIDRCGEEETERAVAGGKTLTGAMSAIESAAKRHQHGNCAVLRDAEIYDAVDTYFGIRRNDIARELSRRQAEGASSEPVRPEKKRLNLSFENLI